MKLQIVTQGADARLMANAFNVDDSTDAASWVTAFQAVTNGAPEIYYVTQVFTVGSTTGTNGSTSVLDGAVLQFSGTTARGLVKVTIPAPIDDLFIGDNETVDGADPTGIIADALSLLRTPNGAALAAFVGGHRVRLPASR